ncbi:MAG: CCA tRNA nucleotidyltransferase [Pseudobdellovibrio sp.]
MSQVVSQALYNSQFAVAFAKHPLYSEYIQVKNCLAQKGFVCWVAGGAVRDLILNREVSDFDLVTDATTEQILELFPNALTVGISFGVVKLVISGKNLFFDLATFRRESDYVDGRRPSHIDFATAKEDAGRRDFTINALFWNEDMKEIVDFVGGLKDIEKKYLRCVGDAEVRFGEDHLRILRLLRFSIQLGFKCETVTLAAALARVDLLRKISAERIWAEFQKIILYVKWEEFFKDILAVKIFNFIFDEPEHSFDFKKIDLQVGYAKEKFFYVLIMLFPNQNDLKKKIKNRLKISNDEFKIYDSLKYCLDHLNSYKYADWSFEIEKNNLILKSIEFLHSIERFDSVMLHKIKQEQSLWPAKLINGHDLIGLVPKNKIADVLKEIRLLQFEQPDLDKSMLMKYLDQYKIISMKHNV